MPPFDLLSVTLSTFVAASLSELRNRSIKVTKPHSSHVTNYSLLKIRSVRKISARCIKEGRRSENWKKYLWFFIYVWNMYEHNCVHKINEQENGNTTSAAWSFPSLFRGRERVSKINSTSRKVVKDFRVVKCCEGWMLGWGERWCTVEEGCPEMTSARTWLIRSKRLHAWICKFKSLTSWHRIGPLLHKPRWPWNGGAIVIAAALTEIFGEKVEICGLFRGDSRAPEASIK